MPYLALYRKFRPQGFSDVRGQDHIVKALKNQVISGRLGHAYLFCGTRGTGKTSIAKILSRAVNCKFPVDGSPCGECEMCKGIMEGRFLNVSEIDAASNNGVDNVRDIIEEVSNPPPQGRYRVYIIDEAHMLSAGAFNALLKTLEEPPSYVMFILATTESHKIPITISSRCQRYDFRRIGTKTISDQIRMVIEEEGLKMDEGAIGLVARAADGSMRDALSILDQAVSMGDKDELTYEKTAEILGRTKAEECSMMAAALLKKDIVSVLRHLDRVVQSGKDLSVFSEELIRYLRNLMILKAAGGDAPAAEFTEMLDMEEDQINDAKEMIKNITNTRIIHLVTKLSDLHGELRFSTMPRIIMEARLIGLTSEETSKSQSPINESVTAGSAPPIISPAPPETKAAKEPPKPKISIEALPDDIKRVVSAWGKISSALGGALGSALKNSIVSPGGRGGLLIVEYDDVKRGFLKMNEEEISSVINEKTGLKVSLEFPVPDKSKDPAKTYVDIRNLIDFPVEEEG